MENDKIMKDALAEIEKFNAGRKNLLKLKADITEVINKNQEILDNINKTLGDNSDPVVLNSEVSSTTVDAPVENVVEDKEEDVEEKPKSSVKKTAPAKKVDKIEEDEVEDKPAASKSPAKNTKTASKPVVEEVEDDEEEEDLFADDDDDEEDLFADDDDADSLFDE